MFDRQRCRLRAMRVAGEPLRHKAEEWLAPFPPSRNRRARKRLVRGIPVLSRPLSCQEVQERPLEACEGQVQEVQGQERQGQEGLEEESPPPLGGRRSTRSSRTQSSPSARGHPQW